MISFSIDFPENLVEPKGLHIPRGEDVEQAVALVKLALDYFPDIEAVADGEDWDFIVKVSDEISLIDRKLCDCSDLGEGICFHPSITEWTLTSIFETILYTLIGPKTETRTDVEALKSKTIEIPIEDLAIIADQMKTVINFVWMLGGKMPDCLAKTLVSDFCVQNESIIDASIDLEKLITQKRA